MTGPYLDTSALAKWYLNESFSEELEEYLSTLASAQISSLTRVEMRCLVARRRRQGEILLELELQILGQLRQDIRDGFLRVLPLADASTSSAVELMDRLTEHPLRTLDALHLALAKDAGVALIATADRTMATAAEALGFAVKQFFR